MRALRRDCHITDAANLPVKDDTFGCRQAVITKFHHIEPPEFQRSDQKMPLKFREYAGS